MNTINFNNFNQVFENYSDSIFHQEDTLSALFEETLSNQDFRLDLEAFSLDENVEMEDVEVNDLCEAFAEITSHRDAGKEQLIGQLVRETLAQLDMSRIARAL